MFDINLRQYFTPKAIADTLEKLPPLSTPVIDKIYPEPSRKQHQFPVLGFSEIKKVVKNVPVVRRGSVAVSVEGDTGAMTYIEPQPIEVSTFMSAKELNDMKLLSDKGIQEHIADKIDFLRRVVRKTTEALAAQSLTGEISYPMKTATGYDTYTVNFGSTFSYTITTRWDDSSKKLSGVLDDLIGISEAISENGYSNIVFLAGSGAFSALANLVLSTMAETKIAAQITEKNIVVAGFTVELMNSKYVDLTTGDTKYAVPTNKICAVSLDAPNTLYYCAIDDIEAGLVAMPFFATPDTKKNPSGVEIIGKSKPLPVPVVDAICWATVTS
ncbi:MAG TPA: major capsid protein [Candidatus Hydrothermia bacterium]|nr:major capsid protein [Candidatus Hydrothermia bacterium]